MHRCSPSPAGPSRRPAAAAARIEGATVYADNQQVIDHPGVEAVILAMPPKWHAEWAVKAAQAGKHVFCEKPMARSLAEEDPTRS